MPRLKFSFELHCYSGVRKRCGECIACTRDDCKDCASCKNMKKYGGPGTKKRCCEKRKCLKFKKLIK